MPPTKDKADETPPATTAPTGPATPATTAPVLTPAQTEVVTMTHAPEQPTVGSDAVASGAGRAPRPAPFLSEGMRHDLDSTGSAVDPASGARFVKDPKTGEITVHDKLSGEVFAYDRESGQMTPVTPVDKGEKPDNV